jgi:hypothetical protein
LTSRFTDPLFPLRELWAVIVTRPCFFPVTTPFADTLALSVFELDQT